MLMTASAPVGSDQQPRLAPNNIEAEQALLGVMLVHPEAHDRTSDIVDGSHFFEPLHAEIFDAIAKLSAGGRHPTPVALNAHFERFPPIDDGLTVPQYLVRLAANAAPIISARSYAETIRDLATRRQLILIGEETVASAYEAGIDTPPRALIEEAEHALFALAEKGDRRSRGAVTFAVSMNSTLDQINAAAQNGTGLRGLPTGLIDLDSKLGGLAKTDLIILAGRPSMGKTALLANVAWHVAHKLELPVDLYSLEMSHEQLTRRILAGECEVSAADLARGTVPREKLEHVNRVGINIAKAPLWIDDEGGISIAQLAARARRRKRTHGTALLGIDYIQLMRGSGKENRVQDVTEITMGLKALAKEIDAPIIALSQLSRQVENRENKRPQLSDLRESGSIEQDADVVLFTYREEYYVQRREPSVTDLDAHLKWEDELRAVEGLAETIIGKQRHGPTGTVRLAFDGALARFSCLAHDHGGHYA